MAKATTKTWLSLDRFAALVGINPLHFNGVTSLVVTNVCEDIWFQYAYQSGNRLSREDVAFAIREAEERIANEVGYNLMPDWVIDERARLTQPAPPELFNPGWNARGLRPSVEMRRGHFLSGGQRAKTLVAAAQAVVYTDSDGDTYLDMATVTVTTDVAACELRAYFPVSVIGADNAAADEFEVRPIKVYDDGAQVRLVMRREQLPLPNLWERLDATGIDGADNANFLTTVDVYRVINDPQVQAEFHWEIPNCGSCGGAGCSACEVAAQAGCLTGRNYRLGIAAYNPGVWSAEDSAFTSGAWAECREPDRVRLWYYSGWRDNKLACPLTGLDPYWERVIANFALALMDRKLCDCNNVMTYAEYMSEDLALSKDDLSFANTERLLNNPFGTKRGAWHAWLACGQPGRKIG